MRAAVLHLAFTELGAEEAVSGAFEHNHASQSISRKLAYQPDGIQRHAVRGAGPLSVGSVLPERRGSATAPFRSPSTGSPLAYPCSGPTLRDYGNFDSSTVAACNQLCAIEIRHHCDSVSSGKRFDRVNLIASYCNHLICHWMYPSTHFSR